MNQFTTPLKYHYENFNNKYGELLPAFIKWDCEKNNYIEINPKENLDETKPATYFGDNWNDELEKEDQNNLNYYFQKILSFEKKIWFYKF